MLLWLNTGTLVPACAQRGWSGMIDSVQNSPVNCQEESPSGRSDLLMWIQARVGTPVPPAWRRALPCSVCDNSQAVRSAQGWSRVWCGTPLTCEEKNDLSQFLGLSIPLSQTTSQWSPAHPSEWLLPLVSQPWLLLCFAGYGKKAQMLRWIWDVPQHTLGPWLSLQQQVCSVVLSAVERAPSLWCLKQLPCSSVLISYGHTA